MDSGESWWNILESLNLLLIDELWKERRIGEVVDDIKKSLPVHRDYFLKETETNCQCTLSDLKKGLFERFNVTASTEVIRLHLDALLYTLKDIGYEPEQGNSAENKAITSKFASSLLDTQRQESPILYMDETNFNLHIIQWEGRSKRGSWCTEVSAGSRGANIYLIGCIGSQGLLHHAIKRCLFKKKKAAQWNKDCLKKVFAIYEQPEVLVIDNSPCHSGVEHILTGKFKEHKIIRLAPYSPMLNPIESVWSEIESKVKTYWLNRFLHFWGKRTMQDSVVLNLEWELENIVQCRIAEISNGLCNRFIAKVHTYTKCI